jgi:hypothetical protein
MTIFFQDIEEAVVMKQTKKHNLQRNGEEEVKPKPKENPQPSKELC